MKVFIPLKFEWVRDFLLREKFTVIWLKMKTCLVLHCQVDMLEKHGHLVRNWKWKEDFYIFRQVRLWSSLPVEAVETKHKFQKWILQCVWLSLTVWCSHCSALWPHSNCNESGAPAKFNFNHVHASDPKLKSVVSAIWGLRRKRVGVSENKSF